MKKREWLTMFDWGIRGGFLEEMVFKLRIRCIKGDSHERMGSPRAQWPQHGKKAVAWDVGRSV